MFLGPSGARSTRTSVAGALEDERAVPQPFPALHKLLACVLARKGSRDCLVSFDERRCSVPLAPSTTAITRPLAHYLRLAEEIVR